MNRVPCVALPIACSLTASELGPRLEEIRALGATELRSAETRGATAVLRFPPEAAAHVTAIAAAEAGCCAFLAFDVQATDDETVLRITAPDGAEPVLAALVAAFGHPA